MKLILLTNQNFIGDNNQLVGIASAIVKKMKSQITWEKIEESDFLSSNFAGLDESSIVFVSGDHGLEVFQQIKRQDARVKVLWSGHQYFSELDNLEQWPDFIALPKTAMTEVQKQNLNANCKLVETQGVAHVVDDDTVSLEHQRFQENLPARGKFKVLIGVIIAGDAPTATGEVKIFDPSDAAVQANKIADFIQKKGLHSANTAIMITNGPRTGKHDPKTRKVYAMEPHRSGEIDASSIAFKKTMQEKLTESTIFFYDFQFAKLKQGSSAYKPMIKEVVTAESGFWFVPSESTSMVTESGYLAQKGVSVVIYHPASENPAHLAHAEEFKKAGLGTDIDSDLQNNPQKPTFVLASEQIAQVVYAEIILNQTKDSLIKGSFFPKYGDESIAPDSSVNNNTLSLQPN